MLSCFLRPRVGIITENTPIAVWQEELKQFRDFVSECCVLERSAYVPCSLLQSAWIASAGDGKKRKYPSNMLVMQCGFLCRMSGNVVSPVVVGIRLESWPMRRGEDRGIPVTYALHL